MIIEPHAKQRKFFDPVALNQKKELQRIRIIITKFFGNAVLVIRKFIKFVKGVQQKKVLKNQKLDV